MCGAKPTIAALLKEFEYMKQNGAGEHHIKNELDLGLQCAIFLGPDTIFFHITKSQVTSFLDSRNKSKDIDPDERYKTTCNDYLGAIRQFLKWPDNQRGKERPARYCPEELKHCIAYDNHANP